jgi:hypothetical protein
MIQTTPLRPTMRRLLAVGALAFVLGGMAVNTAGAETRNQAVKEANTAIEACVESGGDPDANVTNDDDGDIFTSCDYDGGTLYCNWMASKDYVMSCFLVNNQDTHAPVNGNGTLDDGNPDPGSTPNSSGGTEQASPPVVHHHHHKHGHHRHHG